MKNIQEKNKFGAIPSAIDKMTENDFNGEDISNDLRNSDNDSLIKLHVDRDPVKIFIIESVDEKDKKAGKSEWENYGLKKIIEDYNLLQYTQYRPISNFTDLNIIWEEIKGYMEKTDSSRNVIIHWSGHTNEENELLLTSDHVVYWENLKKYIEDLPIEGRERLIIYLSVCAPKDYHMIAEYCEMNYRYLIIPEHEVDYEECEYVSGSFYNCITKNFCIDDVLNKMNEAARNFYLEIQRLDPDTKGVKYKYYSGRKQNINNIPLESPIESPTGELTTANLAAIGQFRSNIAILRDSYEPDIFPPRPEDILTNLDDITTL